MGVKTRQTADGRLQTDTALAGQTTPIHPNQHFQDLTGPQSGRSPCMAARETAEQLCWLQTQQHASLLGFSPPHHQRPAFRHRPPRGLTCPRAKRLQLSSTVDASCDARAKALNACPAEPKGGCRGAAGRRRRATDLVAQRRPRDRRHTSGYLTGNHSCLFWDAG